MNRPDWPSVVSGAYARISNFIGWVDAETNLDLGEILDGGLQDRGCREIDGVDADMEPMELTTTTESTTTESTTSERTTTESTTTEKTTSAQAFSPKPAMQSTTGT